MRYKRFSGGAAIAAFLLGLCGPLGVSAAGDLIPPAAINNLHVSGVSTFSLILGWTAPGDDGNTGTASSYEVRYSTSPISTPTAYANAAIASPAPAPGPAGTLQTMTVNGLSADTQYYFAIKTKDEEPNTSAISNTPSLSTVPGLDSIAPAPVTTLTLSGGSTTSLALAWTAPGDDLATGTADQYDIRYSTSPISSEFDFSVATQVSGVPAPAVAGTVQSMLVTGLSPSTLYYFALKTKDEVPNISNISNLPSRSTATAPDFSAPAAVTDLAVTASATTSLSLGWTAPGDDANVGTAAQYDLRYSTSPITAGNFASATTVLAEPLPSAAGTHQSMIVSGLLAGTTYYFAMKTQDEIPNVSTVSNVPSLSTPATADVTPPAAITDLALSAPTSSTLSLGWTAPGDDNTTGTAALYDIRYSTAPIVLAGDFTAATPVTGEPVPSVAGTHQTMTVSGLAAGTAYYFAMKTQDEVPNISAVSNMTSNTTVSASSGSSGGGGGGGSFGGIVNRPDVTPPVITDVSVTSITKDSAVISWTTDEASDALVRYGLSDAFGEEKFDVTQSLHHVMTLTGLALSTSYQYTVCSSDAAKNQGCVGVFDFMTLSSSGSALAYSSADALAASPDISTDKDLSASASSTSKVCAPTKNVKLANDGNPQTQFDTTIYYCGINGLRYAFPDEGTYFNWYKDFSNLRIVTAEELASVPLGGNVTYRPGSRLLKIESDPKVYAIGKGAVLRWVKDEATARALFGASWNKMVSDIAVGFFSSSYSIGVPIDSLAGPTASACSLAHAIDQDLALGSDDADVMPLQELLKCLGDFPETAELSGHFGTVTATAVERFQTSNGLAAVGHLGPATRAALNSYVKP
jgi:hypothetical protein